MVKLPPLNPLHVFEVTARLKSFTKAAQELGVTQSAVSRQIAILEAFLGTQLFRREPHGAVLTPVATNLSRDISPAFLQIQAATERAIALKSAEPLKVRVFSTFAVKWLLPRLAAFEARHPDIELRLSNGDADVNFANDDLDLAIVLGDGKWPRCLCDRLIQDEIAPVCSPALPRAKSLRSIDDLRHYRLLHSRNRRRDWPDWLTHATRATVSGCGEIEFSNSLLTYQGAIEGLGVAVGQVRLLGQDLEAGSLICPFETTLERDLAYYLVRPEARSMNPKVRAFRSWLLEAVDGTDAKPRQARKRAR